MEEEPLEHSTKTTMVLWVMFLGLNVAKDDKVVEEGLVVQTKLEVRNL